jgi:hypothetical protein
MNRLHQILTLLFLLIVVQLSAKEEGPENFPVNDLTFSRPAEWTWQQPTSSMRKAQLSAPGKDGAADVVFFYFGPGGAGGVQANVDRWIGQFKELNKKEITSNTTGGVNVTYVEAEGTFMDGPPFGEKVAKEGYGLLGAIIEAKGGAIFIKMTGPEKTVSKSKGDFVKMTEKALK